MFQNSRAGNPGAGMTRIIEQGKSRALKNMPAALHPPCARKTPCNTYIWYGTSATEVPLVLLVSLSLTVAGLHRLSLAPGLWYFLLLTLTHTAIPERAHAVVRPQRALAVQVHLAGGTRGSKTVRWSTIHRQ
jgi:hypothetical protein